MVYMNHMENAEKLSRDFRDIISWSKQKAKPKHKGNQKS